MCKNAQTNQSSSNVLTLQFVRILYCCYMSSASPRCLDVRRGPLLRLREVRMAGLEQVRYKFQFPRLKNHGGSWNAQHVRTEGKKKGRKEGTCIYQLASPWWSLRCHLFYVAANARDGFHAILQILLLLPLVDYIGPIAFYVFSPQSLFLIPSHFPLAFSYPPRPLLHSSPPHVSLLLVLLFPRIRFSGLSRTGTSMETVFSDTWMLGWGISPSQVLLYQVVVQWFSRLG